MKEQTHNLVKLIAQGKTDEAKSVFNDIMNTHKDSAIEAQKIATAKKIYGEK
jgi:hypothetical protein